MAGNAVLGGVVRTIGILFFFTGIFILAQAYTMAFHGVYLDCFGGEGCSIRTYGDPTLSSVLYGTALALAAMGTFYLGTMALRWAQNARASQAAK